MGHGGRGPNIPLRRELDIEERVARAMKSSVRLLGKQVPAIDMSCEVVFERSRRIVVTNETTPLCFQSKKSVRDRVEL